MRHLIFRLLHRGISRYPWWIILISFASAAGVGIYGAVHMQMITDQDRLLSEDLEYHKRYMDFIRRFGDLEFLYILIQGPTETQMIQFADRLAARFQDNPNIEKIIYSFDTSWAKDYVLHYAPLTDVQQLRAEILSASRDIKRLADQTNLDAILLTLSESLERDRLLKGETPQEEAGSMEDLLRALRGETNPDFAALDDLEKKIEAVKEDGVEYQWLADKEYLLMLVMPSKDYSTLSVIKRPLQEIRTLIDLTKTEFPGITAGLTGRPALQADEMRTTNRDMNNSSLIALLGVTILFGIFFREWARPLLAVLALLIAFGWTYGFVALTLGHLNLLSLVFALVLIGLGVDFGIHFLHRYQEELGKSGDPSDAIHGALQGVGSGIVTGAVTSSIAFLLALITDFLGLAELGYVAGIGILFCLVAMLVVMAAMIYTYDRRRHASAPLPSPVHLIGLRHVSRYPRFMVAVCFAVTLLLLPHALDVRFDDNLLKLQADGLESVAYEHILLEKTEQSSWFCAFLRNSVDEIRAVSAELHKKATVSEVSSIAEMLPEPSPHKTTFLKDIHDLLQPIAGQKEVAYYPNPFLYKELRGRLSDLFDLLDRQKEWIAQQKILIEEQKKQAEAAKAMQDQIPLEGDPPGEMNLEALPPEMRAMQGELMNGLMNGAQLLPPEMTEMPKEVTIPEEDLNRLKELHRLLEGAESMVRRRLEAANDSLIAHPKRLLRLLARLSGMPAPTPDVLPAALRDMYIGKDGSYLVMAFPKENIWETAPMEKFVAEMREVDPTVTGTPVQVYESSLLMRDSFITIALYSFLVVAVLVYLDFLSFSALFYTLFPLALGVVWLLEIMGYFDLHLNLANFFAIPILIGIGVDNAVHFYHRFLETHDVEISMYTTGTTLTLTTLTTVTGFGSLIFASHKGLASLGALMALGSATCWLSCVVLLPALIKCFHRHG